MRIIKRIIIFVVVIAIVLSLMAGGGWIYVSRKPFPQISGTIHVAGLQGTTTAIRDKWGVPHIYADTPHDLFFAQGYVTAQDRLWQMEFSRRVSAGRLSEILGGSTIYDDLFIRTIGWRRAAQADYNLLAQPERDVLQWYADGVNAFINTHRDSLPLEFTLLGLTGVRFMPEPWTPVDSLSWSKVMAWDLSGNHVAELIRSRILALYGDERGRQVINALWPPYPSNRPIIVPSGVAWQVWGKGSLADHRSFLPLFQMNRAEIGSNSWVIAGSHTVTGKPVLANDMHLDLQMPSTWYEISLHCLTVNMDCPYDVVGYSFPGFPGVIVGHNDKITWGATNLGSDAQDLYVEHVNPGNPNQVEFMGQWEDMRVVTETVRIAGKRLPDDFKPTATTQVSYDAAANVTSVTLNVRMTRHGPILNEVIGSLRDSPNKVALQWTAFQPGAESFTAVMALDRAQNWQDFRAALSHWSVPTQNFVFADEDGNIGYQAAGLVPIRANLAKDKASNDGSLPVSGWTGEHEWKGYVPFDQLPSRFNPSEGFIVTANNAVVDSQYPFFIARDWDYGYRAQRITDLIRAKDKLSIEDIKAIQSDTYVLFSEQLLPYLTVVRANTPVQKAALDALVKWDHFARQDSVGAAVFEAITFHLVENTFADELGNDLMGGYWGTSSLQRAAIAALLDHPHDPIWDDTRTSDRVETRDDILQRAFEDACVELQSRLGNNVARWTWGQLHTITFRNNPLGMSGIGLVEAIFNRGPMTVDGTASAVNNTASSPWEGNRYQVISGPSERYIADLTDWAHSLSIHTTGQSGLPSHKHYDDFIDLWRRNEYHAMPWSRAEVEKSAEGTLVLQP